MDECWHRLQNLKVDGYGKTTMVPFHWSRQGNNNEESKTDETLLGSFNLFSTLTQARYWPGKESLRVTSVPQWPCPYHWRLCKIPGGNQYWPGKENICVKSVPQWPCPYRWLLCKMPGENQYWPGKESLRVTSMSQWTWTYFLLVRLVDIITWQKEVGVKNDFIRIIF